MLHDLSEFTIGTRASLKLNTDEMEIAKFVGSVLHIDHHKLTPRSDFFAIGGDSISAIMLCRKMNEAKFSITAKELFKLRTIEKISKKRLPLKDSKELHLVSQNGLDLKQSSSRYPASSEQVSYYHAYKANDLAFLCQMVWPLEYPIEHFMNCWTVLVKKYECFRTRFEPVEGGKLFHDISSTVDQFSYRSYHCSLDQYFQDDKKIKFDENTLNWIRFSEIKFGDTKYFGVTTHHIAYDGWFLDILFSELDFLLRGSEIIQKINSPRLFFVYTQSEEYQAKSKDYWIKFMEGFSPKNVLLQPKNICEQSANFVTLLEIPYNTLTNVSQKFNVTSRILVKLAWGIAIQKILNTNDICFIEVVSGRMIDIVPEVESMGGNMMSSLPCRVKITKTTRLQELITNLWKDQIERMDHEAISIPTLIKWTGIDPAQTLLNIHAKVRSSNPIHNPIFGPSNYYHCERLVIEAEMTRLEGGLLEMNYSYFLSCVLEEQIQSIHHFFSSILSKILHSDGDSVVQEWLNSL